MHFKIMTTLCHTHAHTTLQVTKPTSYTTSRELNSTTRALRNQTSVFIENDGSAVKAIRSHSSLPVPRALWNWQLVRYTSRINSLLRYTCLPYHWTYVSVYSLYTSKLTLTTNRTEQTTSRGWITERSEDLLKIQQRWAHNEKSKLVDFWNPFQY